MSAEPAVADAGHGAHDGHAPNGSDAHGDGAERFLQHHFQDLNVQSQAARLGMWLFLSTEILLFGGLFVGYALFRKLYGHGFHEASHHLSAFMGMMDTFILITSSFTMAMAIYCVQIGKKNYAVALLLATIGFGLGFLVVHGFEYWHDIQVGAVPGKYFHVKGMHVEGAPMFYTLYFLMTGLHSLHVLIGAAILAVLTYFTWRGDYSARYLNPLENGGLYWHLIDLIWIFLFPLLYLIA
jgi:cytochrome c oxidase subunit 3